MSDTKKIVLAVTGASGAVYAQRLAEILTASGCRLHLIVSPNGAEMARRELAEPITPAGGQIVRHDYADIADPLASGSVPTDAMAVCPCSSNTLAAIAAGLADNLITRAAHVHLKQRRPLVLVPRETPVSAIELANQLSLARAGAVIAPASPGFYLHPLGISDLVDFLAARVAQCLGVEHDLDVQYRTGEEPH